MSSTGSCWLFTMTCGSVMQWALVMSLTIDIITHVQQDPNFLRDTVKLFVNEEMLTGPREPCGPATRKASAGQLQIVVSPQQPVFINLNPDGDGSIAEDLKTWAPKDSILILPMSSDPRTVITIASIIVGNLVNWLLHGILTSQLYFYYLAFPGDKKWTKIVVYAVYTLDTVQVIALGIILILIVVDGEPYAGALTYHSYWWGREYKWCAQELLINSVGGLVPLIVQCVYARRIQIITQKKIFPVIIVTIAILQFFSAILMSLISDGMILFWTGLDVVNDLIIANIMVRNLLKEEPLSNNFKFKVIRLVRLITRTGTLTVAANLFSFTLLLLDAWFMTGWIGMAIHIFIPKLYANSMMVMLNNRKTIRNSRDTLSNMITGELSALVVASNHQFGHVNTAPSRDDFDPAAISNSATNLSN